jgi:hypothetical protein
MHSSVGCTPSAYGIILLFGGGALQSQLPIGCSDTYNFPELLCKIFFSSCKCLFLCFFGICPQNLDSLQGVAPAVRDPEPTIKNRRIDWQKGSGLMKYKASSNMFSKYYLSWFDPYPVLAMKNVDPATMFGSGSAICTRPPRE